MPKLLLVVSPPQFKRWWLIWSSALVRAGFDVDSYNDQLLAPHEGVVVMNVFGHLELEQVKVVEQARGRNMPVYFLESWGLGFGVGPNHNQTYQKAVARLVGASYKRSPIDASFGAHDGYLNRDVWSLLGPASAERSKFVVDFKEFEEDALTSALEEQTKPTQESSSTNDGAPHEASLSIGDWARATHSNARAKGFWDPFMDAWKENINPLSPHELLGFLMLAVGEAGEAAQEVRQPGFDPKQVYFISGGNHINYESWSPESGVSLPKPEGLAIEIADVILRLLDLCESQGIDLERAMRLKHEYNKTRPRMHGGKRA